MNVYGIIQKVSPDYIVHFGALSHVKVRQEMEKYTFCVNRKEDETRCENS